MDFADSLSTSKQDRTDWQRLPDHLAKVGFLAGRVVRSSAHRKPLCWPVSCMTSEIYAGVPGAACGATERVDHSTAGAAVVTGLARGDDRIIAELIAYAIAGHHAGLPDRRGEFFSTLDERLKGFSEATLDPVWRHEIKPEATGLLPDLDWRFDDKARFAFQVGFLGRMIFSCLVDADFKDTEQFYARIEGREVDREWPALQSILPGLLDAFDRHMGRMRNTETPVNRLRAEILDHVRSHAADAPGLFTLTVPTGGGKTLASLGFALDHARAHGHERIIYAIPFTAIIDQTAAIFRGILGDDVVLEHHSAIEDEK